MNTDDQPVRGAGPRRLVLGLAAALAVITLVYLAGLHLGLWARWGLFSGALAFPGVVFAGLLAASLGLGVLALASRMRSRIVLFSVGGVTGALLVAFLVTAFTMPVPLKPDAVAEREEGQLRVLGWNVVQGAEDAASRNQLIERMQPDVVVFGELYDGNLQPGDVPAGYTSYGVRGIAVTVFVADTLPAYRVVSADESGRTSGYVMEPEDAGDAPRIVAVHLSRLSVRGDDADRNAALDWAADSCDSSNTIALGDFNSVPANMPNGTLGQCRAVGTFAPSWPSSVPPLFGAAIDNVLATAEWDAARVATLDIPGIVSDHRPIVADLEKQPSASVDSP